MKFTNGYWLVRPGVTADYARQDYAIHVGPDHESLEVLAPTHAVHGRADTMNVPVLHVRITSPAEGVVRVRVSHWDGAEEAPGFPLNADKPGNRPYVSVRAEGNADGEAGKDGAWAELTTGHLTARVVKGEPWNLTFLHDGKELTSSSGKSLANMRLSSDAAVSAAPVGEFGVSRDGSAYDESPVFTSIQLRLAVGESVYGFGEQFGSFVKNGQSIDIWNEDGGTASEQAYKNVPFYQTSKGYGVLVNNRGHVSFEVGSESTEVVQFSVPGETLDFCVVDGPEPRQVLERYTALTGRPAKVPAWSYGLWLTTSFTTNYDEKTVTSFIDGMAKRDIPLSVFHYDCFWMSEFKWTDFTWDKRYFSDVEGTLERLHKRGLHVCCWINPYISQYSALFAEGKEKGYLVRKADGTVWQTDLWQPGLALVDFTNPQARSWYQGKVETLLRQGVDAIKTDFGERIPRDVVWHDHSPKLSMHNWYTQLYNETVFDAIKKVHGEGEAVLFARSATVGGQKEPVHWGGDCESTFNGMAQELRAGLSFTSSGFSFWSHDIGGFEGHVPDSAVYKRWLAFGLLGSHSRLHGSTVYRVPWLFDEWDEKNGKTIPKGQSAVDVAREFVKLKLSLMPYLYRVGLDSHETGMPVMRSMFLQFPHDQACRTLDRQYMLGPDLLVAPVFTYSGDVDYYLPAGTWTDWFTGETVTTESGQWRHEVCGYDRVPLWVRGGSLLVTKPGSERPDYDYADHPLVRIYPGMSATSARARVTTIDGRDVTYTAQREGDHSLVVNSSDGGDFAAAYGQGRQVESKNGKAVLEI